MQALASGENGGPAQSVCVCVYVCMYVYRICMQALASGGSGGPAQSVCMCVCVCMYVCMYIVFACKHLHRWACRVCLSCVYVYVCVYDCMYIWACKKLHKVKVAGLSPSSVILRLYIFSYHHACMHARMHIYI